MTRRKRILSGMHGLLIAATVLMLCIIVTACEEEKKEVVAGHNDPESTPTMLTRNVETLISDSGIMRYRITSPLWLVFDEARVPHWKFPNGLKLEKYDDFFNKQATVDCDSAFYFKNQQLWRLDGNVKIENVAHEKFVTNQLYWDQKAHKVYSDSFIRIEQPDRMIEGYGFVSNDKMTSYSIRNVMGVFPVEGLKKQATAVDSTGTPTSAGGTSFQPAPAAQLPSDVHGKPQAAPATNPSLKPDANADADANKNADKK